MNFCPECGHSCGSCCINCGWNVKADRYEIGKYYMISGKESTTLYSLRYRKDKCWLMENDRTIQIRGDKHKEQAIKILNFLNCQ